MKLLRSKGFRIDLELGICCALDAGLAMAVEGWEFN